MHSKNKEKRIIKCPNKNCSLTTKKSLAKWTEDIQSSSAISAGNLAWSKLLTSSILIWLGPSWSSKVSSSEPMRLNQDYQSVLSPAIFADAKTIWKSWTTSSLHCKTVNQKNVRRIELVANSLFYPSIPISSLLNKSPSRKFQNSSDRVISPEIWSLFWQIAI